MPVTLNLSNLASITPTVGTTVQVAQPPKVSGFQAFLNVLPKIGAAVTGAGQIAGAVKDTADAVSGRSKSQSLVQTGKSLVDEANMATKLVPWIAGGLALVLLVVFLKRR